MWVWCKINYSVYVYVNRRAWNPVRHQLNSKFDQALAACTIFQQDCCCFFLFNFYGIFLNEIMKNTEYKQHYCCIIQQKWTRIWWLLSQESRMSLTDRSQISNSLLTTVPLCTVHIWDGSRHTQHVKTTWEDGGGRDKAGGGTVCVCWWCRRKKESDISGAFRLASINLLLYLCSF